MQSAVASLADTLVLGPLLEKLAANHGGYEVLAHWTQGEFHHDVVLRVKEAHDLPGSVLVVATNCNGSMKEVLAFDDVPDRDALWHWRCPTIGDFTGTLRPVLGEARTVHFFDPCELLVEDARSELRPEHRTRQHGGGWCAR